MLWVNDISLNEGDFAGIFHPPTFPESVHHRLSKKLQATSAKRNGRRFQYTPEV